MSGIAGLERILQPRLEELARKHGVVGASVAVQQGDDVIQAVTGLNQRPHRSSCPP